MNLLSHHWNFDPLVIVSVLLVVAHEIGLGRMARRSRTNRARSRRRRSWVFYGGLFLTLLAVSSPLDYWSSQYFYLHMVEHLLIGFFAPALIVIGAPWLPLAFSLPVGLRRVVLRFILLEKRTSALRAVGRFIRNRWFALFAVNFVMILWHIPAMFDLAERNEFVHVWLLHGSFFLFGTLFWLQVLPSYPVRPSGGTLWRSGAIICTNVTMFVVAMSLSIFSAVSWYASYAHLHGVTLSPYADQQIGAAILWVCGDFWAVPALIWVVKRGIEDEGPLGELIDRMISGRQSTALET